MWNGESYLSGQYMFTELQTNKHKYCNRTTEFISILLFYFQFQFSKWNISTFSFKTINETTQHPKQTEVQQKTWPWLFVISFLIHMLQKLKRMTRIQYSISFPLIHVFAPTVCSHLISLLSVFLHKTKYFIKYCH